MEIEDVVKEGRQSNEIEELNKGSGEKGGSTEELVSTAKPKIVGTARPDVDAARQEDSAVEPRTPPTTTSKYKHNQLNKKTFEDIQALYIKEQERDADFVPIRSKRDEKIIDKMNKKSAGMDEEEVPEEIESTKVEVKQE
ncbi:hypothetical protein Tco_1157977, partial [Tanacetum coccineum]